jgi:hypothetical protein
MNGYGSHGWAGQAEVSPIHNGHDWMILFRDPMMAVNWLARLLPWRGPSVTGQR